MSKEAKPIDEFEQMTARQQEVMYLRMALALAQISVNDFTAELIIDMCDGVHKKKGKFNIEDAVSIEWNLRKRYRQIQAVENPSPPTENTESLNK